ncbi:MAG: polymerase ECF-type sigma factor, polymerase sigma-70 factor, subfamily [Candidatus Taylorbacteria bacterium]|nr:polymerase ECF-type sigma factor, polymerase sigma-70 factor, subfamily [Candidatus Taylorbacteria bacterium]
MTRNQIIENQNMLAVAHQEYGRGLSNYSYFKVYNHALAEDLVQDTFLKTWNYLMKGGKIDAMKSFLYHVLNCLIIDEYRRRRVSSLDDLLEKGYEPSCDCDDLEHNTDVLDGKAIAGMIDLLPKKYSEVLKMRYVKDLSIAEIAKATKQSKNTIAVQIHRGLMKLKELVDTDKTDMHNRAYKTDSSEIEAAY